MQTHPKWKYHHTLPAITQFPEHPPIRSHRGREGILGLRLATCFVFAHRGVCAVERWRFARYPWNPRT